VAQIPSLIYLSPLPRW